VATGEEELLEIAHVDGGWGVVVGYVLGPDWRIINRIDWSVDNDGSGDLYNSDVTGRRRDRAFFWYPLKRGLLVGLKNMARYRSRVSTWR
jgi:hypothetical protein